ncbi:hypothetical protein EfmJHP36_22060 [Enterococcus faecium]|nr:hypothetical protein EfmJHP36_22060 [Enterococcus faecium]
MNQLNEFWLLNDFCVPEVIRLRAENAYLKKLETLIQEQDLSKKKSRLKQSFSFQ